MAAVDRTQVCVVRGSGELLLRERPAGRAAERLARGHDDEGLAVERGQCLRLLERPPARRHFVTGGTCGSPDGTFAEYARAAEDRLSPKPATLTFEQAALPVSGMTALQAVRDHGGVTPGQHVLSLGNSGGVGSSAVQIAETHGATVTGVASRGEADFVRSLGAEPSSTTPPGVRPTAATTSSSTFGSNMPVSRLRRALTSTGTLVIVGGEAGGRVLGGLQRQLGASLLSPFLRQRLGTKAHADDLAVLTGLVDAGQVTRALDRVLPLTAAAIALHVLVQGAVRGKLVLSADPVIAFGLVSDAGPGPTARRSSAVPSVDAH